MLVCCMYVLLVGLLLVVGRLCVVGVCWCWYVDCIGCWLLLLLVVGYVVVVVGILCYVVLFVE